MMNFMNLLAEANEAVAVTAADATAATETTGAATTAAPGGDMMMTIIMMVAMVAIFYFFLIRPQRKKDKQVKNMLAALKPGDKICTIGGIYCTIASLNEEDVTVTMGSQQNVVVIKRWAIRSVENVALENDAEPQI